MLLLGIACWVELQFVVGLVILMVMLPQMLQLIVYLLVVPLVMLQMVILMRFLIVNKEDTLCDDITGVVCLVGPTISCLVGTAMCAVILLLMPSLVPCVGEIASGRL